jgi:hypothetical protein
MMNLNAQMKITLSLQRYSLLLMLAKAYEDVLKQEPKNLRKVVRLAQAEIVYNIAAIFQHQTYRKVIYVRKEKCK